MASSKKGSKQAKLLNTNNENIRRYLQTKLPHLRRHEIEAMSKSDIIKALVSDGKKGRMPSNAATRELIEYLRGHDFMAAGTDASRELQDKIEERSLTEDEYNRILQEIEIHNSILPLSRKRIFTYGHGYGDVILSETTKRMYCMDHPGDRAQLFADYKGSYYSSRTGASGGGYIFAGKTSILLLPTCRKDTKHIEDYSTPINGVAIKAWTDRGIVDARYPVTISNPQIKGCDYAFIDPQNINQIISIIKSGGELPDSFSMFTQKICDYISEDGTTKEITVTYVAEKRQSDKAVRDIALWTGKLAEAQSELEPTGSEFDRVLGIYKSGGNFVEKSSLGVAKKSFGTQNPRYAHFNQQHTYELSKNGKAEKIINEDKLRIRRRTLISENCAYIEKKGDPDHVDLVIELDYKQLAMDDRTQQLYADFIYETMKPRRSYSFRLGNIYGNLTHDGEKIIFCANDIETSKIQETQLAITQKSKQILVDRYQINLSNAFSKAKHDIIAGVEINPGRRQKENLIYVFYDNKVFLGYIAKSAELHSKFAALGENSYQDYEHIISVDERKSKGSNYWISWMRKKAFDKAISDYMNQIRWGKQTQIEEITKYLNQNLSQQHFKDDSIAVRNCIPGTEAFMDKYQLRDGTTSEELLKHPKFKEMLEHGDFRKVILAKIVKQIVD